MWTCGELLPQHRPKESRRETLTWSIVWGGSYRRDGRSTRGRVRTLSVSLYRGRRAHKMILGISILQGKYHMWGEATPGQNCRGRGHCYKPSLRLLMMVMVVMAVMVIIVMVMIVVMVAMAVVVIVVFLMIVLVMIVMVVMWLWCVGYNGSVGHGAGNGGDGDGGGVMDIIVVVKMMMMWWWWW